MRFTLYLGLASTFIAYRPAYSLLELRPPFYSPFASYFYSLTCIPSGILTNLSVPPIIHQIKTPSGGPCNCMATEHDFLLNCQHCGRLICVLESTEICYACGSDPRTEPPEDNPVATFFSEPQISKANATTQITTQAEQNRAALQKALSQRDELLHRQATQESQLMVHDEQRDFYDNSIWMTPQDRVVVERERAAEEAREAAAHDHSSYQVHIDWMRKNISVSANIRSSLSNNLPSVPKDDVSDTHVRSMREQAAERAMQRLAIQSNLDVRDERTDFENLREHVHTSTNSEFVKSQSRENHPKAGYVDPFLKNSSAAEIRNTKQKMEELRRRRKVHYDPSMNIEGSERVDIP